MSTSREIALHRLGTTGLTASPSLVASLLAAGMLIGSGLTAGKLTAQEPGVEQPATGIVFHDANRNRRFDAGERPLPGVRVSNGRTIAVTGADGRYTLPVDDDDILFVIKPRGYQTPLSPERLPQFYYIHKPEGSPQLKFAGVKPTGPLPASVDFPLTPQDEPDVFRAILFGDPQPRDQQEVDFIAHDVVHELIGTDASLGVTLGDIAFDNLDTFDPLNRTIALIGIPWYNVIGNHDVNKDARHDRHSDETFERVYGPSYYSFDYGQVHFLVLDDIEWIVPGDGGKPGFRGGLGKEQMEFIRNDLSLVPDQQLVVLMMHVPLVDVADRHELYRLIERRPFCLSISGHTHHHEHRFITDKEGWQGPQPHHHIINVTVCGSWWSGAPDERGIPHSMMADGGPNGYSIITFDGTKYSLDYKAAGRGADYQLQIHAPDAVEQAQAAATDVYANVFNGSERSKVEMRIGGGPWRPLQHTREIDPQYQAVYDKEQKQLASSPAWRALPKPKPSTHLWKAKLPEDLQAGTHLIHVRTTDMEGRTYAAQRVLRVTGEAAAGTVRVAGIVLKWLRADKEANYRRAEGLIREAAAGGAQLVCTTECFLDGYAIKDKSIPLDQYQALGEPLPDGPYVQKLARLADELDLFLVAGMLEADGAQRFNTAVLFDRDGKLVGRYRKQELGHELVRNTPGAQSPVFDTPFGRMGVMICADRRTPELVQKLGAGGAEFLLCPSGGMFGPQTNDPILQARSRENGLPIVFVHPAEFLVTGADGGLLAATLLGDQLEVEPSQVGGAADQNQVFYFDLPVRKKSD